jgi:hypothetical protein
LEADDFIFFMSPIFPSKKRGGGPVIPCFRRIDRSLFGFHIRASHICINLVSKPSKAIVMMILRRSNSSSSMAFTLSGRTGSSTLSLQALYYKICGGDFFVLMFCAFHSGISLLEGGIFSAIYGWKFSINLST